MDDEEVADDWEELSDPAAAAGAAGGGGSGGGGSDDKPAAAVEGLGVEGISLEDAGEEEGKGEEEEEAVEVVSERLYAAFLNGLKKGLKDAQLPMLVSTFYSSVLLPSRPPGTSIDVKKTSYRKISNFLQEMERRGLVTLEVRVSNAKVVLLERVREERVDFWRGEKGWSHQG